MPFRPQQGLPWFERDILHSSDSYIFLFYHEGEFNYIECCEGKYMGQEVGPTDQCDWKYATHQGEQLGTGYEDSNKPSRTSLMSL